MCCSFGKTLSHICPVPRMWPSRCFKLRTWQIFALLALENLGRVSFVFQRFSAWSFSLLPHATSIGECLGETGHVVEASQVSSFFGPAPCEHQNLCWLLCPRVGAFCQGPCLDSQPPDMPRIGKWHQVKSGRGRKTTMPSRASSRPAWFQALASGESLFAKTRLGGFTPL